VADDDPDDRMLTKEAFEQGPYHNRLNFVVDGEDLMDYLLHRSVYNAENAPRPNLILLDLNMPKKDGREALSEIKQHPDLRQIPVVVLTTSKLEEDVYQSYDLGANSFIIKPATFENLVSITAKIGQYWLDLVKLPSC